MKLTCEYCRLVWEEGGGPSPEVANPLARCCPRCSKLAPPPVLAFGEEEEPEHPAG